MYTEFLIFNFTDSATQLPLTILYYDVDVFAVTRNSDGPAVLIRAYLPGVQKSTTVIGIIMAARKTFGRYLFALVYCCNNNDMCAV